MNLARTATAWLVAAVILGGGCRAGMLNSGGWGDDEPTTAPAEVGQAPTGDTAPADRRPSESGARRAPAPVGSEVPAFEVPDQLGRTVTAGELALGGGALLVFLPAEGGAAAPVYHWARREANFLKGRGIELLLVAPVNVETAAAMAQIHDLKLAVLADAKSTVAARFGVGAKGKAPAGVHSFLLAEGRVHLAQPGLPDNAAVVMAYSTKPGAKSGSYLEEVF